MRSLEDVLVFKNNASAAIYVKWCRKIGRNAAEFVANFISLFEEMGDGLIWNSNVLALMREYGEGTYVLNNISTRLYNGMISISRYSFNRDMYKQLFEDGNVYIRAWAIEQDEVMEKAIEKQINNSELHQIYHK